MVIILSSATGANGFDYFEVNPSGAWYYEPSFCFIDITEEKHQLIKGLISWREYMPDGMTYTYKFTDSTEGCDVRIYHDAPEKHGSLTGNALGVATCKDTFHFSITTSNGYRAIHLNIVSDSCRRY